MGLSSRLHVFDPVYLELDTMPTRLLLAWWSLDMHALSWRKILPAEAQYSNWQQ
jgi:hypothetical protein